MYLSCDFISFIFQILLCLDDDLLEKRRDKIPVF